MARQQKIKDQKQCTRCLGFKVPARDFYISYSLNHGDGRVHICKTCLIELFNDKHNGKNTHEVIHDIMKQIDKPYLNHIVDASIESTQKDDDNTSVNVFSAYMKNVVMRQYVGMTYKDSTVESDNHQNENSENNRIDHVVKHFRVTDEIIAKWGNGYTSDEYQAFERKYQMLRNNYQEKTAMHTEALLTYIRYRVKEEIATAKGLAKDAATWGALAQKAAQDAKINPSQLSKSDLSDGLDTFGQLVRTVEQAVDIIPILPKFKSRPKDSVDFTMWCYVNYVRDLKGLPLANYDEVYKFYEERKKEYDKLSVDESGEE